MELADTHAHLNLPGYGEPGEVLARAKEAGVVKVVVVGIDIPTSKKAVELSREFPEVVATAGIHPHEAKTFKEEHLTVLEELLQECVAVGEVGLDFEKEYSPREVQYEVFEAQLALAKRLGLPVVLHVRNAYAEALEVLKKYLPLKAVFHCFTGDESVARKVLDLGFLISATGIITFPKAEVLRSVFRYAPLDSVLVETDSPFLTPVPHRGKKNEPAYVYFVVEKLAELKRLDLERCAEQTFENAKAFFGF